MAADLARAAGSADLSWVLNAYAIVYASLLVLFGRLADRYPRERGFLLGVAVFTAASAACGAATSVPMLVAFRIVQAAGAALLTPTSLGLVLATASPERRHGAVRAWTAVGGLAAALGPVVGGAARRGELAVGVPRQRPHRPARARGRLASSASRRRSPRALPGRARRPAGHRRRRARSRSGWSRARTGAGARPRPSACSRFAALALALFVGHCLRARNPLVDPSAVPRPDLLRRLDRDAALLGRLRGDAAVHRALGPGRSGAGRRSRPGWPSLRAR